MKTHIIHIAIFMSLLFNTIGVTADSYSKIPSDLPLALRFCRSEMLRHPDYKTIDRNTSLKWNYTHGLLCQSILDAYDYYHNDTLDCSDLQEYVNGYYRATITEDGTIYKYKKSNYNIDHINAGKCLFRLYTRTDDNRFMTAMNTLRDQLKDHPRTSEGGYWHKNNYPWQMWLDGLYMGTPFYAEYAKTFEEDPSASYADVIKQFTLVAKYTRDNHSGLYRHGWDEKKQQSWADPVTGQSQHVWGRALGWYTMALVDVLEIIPENVTGRDSLISILQGICEILPKYQNKETGAWYQVVDYPDSTGNYQEMSCTPMFARSIAKGVRLGYLDASLLDVAKKAYRGIIDNYLTIDNEGFVSLKKICSVAGLSNDRDGSYNYYVNQTSTVDNDPKGVGPFIMLCIEMDRIGTQGIKPDDTPSDVPSDTTIIMPDSSYRNKVVWYMTPADTTTATIAPAEIETDMSINNLLSESSTGYMLFSATEWKDKGGENPENYIQYRITPRNGHIVAIDSITFDALRTMTDKMYFSAIYDTHNDMNNATYLCRDIMPTRDAYNSHSLILQQPAVVTHDMDFVFRFLPYPSSGFGKDKYTISYKNVTFHCRVSSDTIHSEIPSDTIPDIPSVTPPDTSTSHTDIIDSSNFVASLHTSGEILTVYYTHNSTSPIRIQLYSIDGRAIYNYVTTSRHAGTHHKEIPIAKLQKGLYFISVSDLEKRITLKYHKK